MNLTHLHRLGSIITLALCIVSWPTVPAAQTLEGMILADLKSRTTPIAESEGALESYICEPVSLDLIRDQGNRYVGKIEYSSVGRFRGGFGNPDFDTSFSCNIDVISDGSSWRVTWDRQMSCPASPLHTQARSGPPWRSDELVGHIMAEACYCLEAKVNGRCERLDLMLGAN